MQVLAAIEKGQPKWHVDVGDCVRVLMGVADFKIGNLQTLCGDC
jgi:hypothetical protein